MCEDSDSRPESTVADVPAHVGERDGFPVIMTDRPMEPMTAEDARSAIERQRR